MARVEPATVEDWNALAAKLAQQGKWGEAVNAYLRSLRLDNRRADTFFHLGNTLLNSGNLPDAIASYRRALSLTPDFPEALNNLGLCLRMTGQHVEAIEVLGRALQLKPDYADALNNLGMCLGEGGMLDDAVAALTGALALKPDFAQALGNLGISYALLGQLDEAIACFRRSSELDAKSSASDNLLFYIHFHSKYGPGRIREEHERWNRQIAVPLKPAHPSHKNDRSPDRRLRIGYVSPNFCRHPVGTLVLPVLEQHDHGRFEIVCYSDVRSGDEITATTRACADGWRDTASLSDAQLAELVLRDRVDILVDLALHMAGNRLLVFARKPAPVQVTCLGYPSTTGLETMDYRLSDHYLENSKLNPESEISYLKSQSYSENTVCLPHGFWCYDPLVTSVEMGELPALTNGFITFGCLNNFAKVTGPTLELWARVMLKVSRSRLMLLAPRGSARMRVCATMTALGIDASRIDFCDRLSREQYLATYGKFDLCLDTIPYPGHTTTRDSLWMGVPVVTLAGATAVSRGGLSILSNVGLSELIARDAEQYVTLVTALANDLPRLSSLRETLRDRLRNSPLMNAPQFARDIESAYRQMWKNWCETHH